MSSAYVTGNVGDGTGTAGNADCQVQLSVLKGKLKRKLSSPSETVGKRFFAMKRRRSSHMGTKCQKYNRHLVRKLLSRQMDNRGCRIFNKHARSHERFRNFSLVSKLDSHFPDNTSDLFKLCFLRKRSKVVEIVSAKDIVFGLTQTGVCTAFDRLTSERICFLNIEPDEVIRSLFYNKSNDSLITVSVYRADNYSSLKCRSTSLEYIRRNKPNMGFNLFETESLRWPGFVEFDDVNGKVLTYSATNKIYKVWDLVNYNLLYSIVDAGIQEIKISPGIMLLIYNRSDVASSNEGSAECVVPLKILAIGTGETLKSFNHKIKPNKKIDFIEQFNEKLLVKQENENLEIVDVRTGLIHSVDSTHFMTPSAFIFLYENQLFLTFRDHMVSVWNFKGELVTTFEDHMLWHPDCNTNNIYITSQQDLIISYCKNKNKKSNFGQHQNRNRILSDSSDEGDHDDDEVSSKGSLNVSDIFTGKCLAKIVAKRSQSNYQEQLRALDDVTALYYNEELNEIYTGNKLGVVHCWSN